MRGLPFKFPPTEAHLAEGASWSGLHDLFGSTKSITSETLPFSCPVLLEIYPVVARILS